MQASYTAYNPTALTQTVQAFRKRHSGLSAIAGLSCTVTRHAVVCLTTEMETSKWYFLSPNQQC